MKNQSRKLLEGEVTIPGSKTHIHRLLFSFLLSKKVNKIYLDDNAQVSGDINETLNVLKECGVNIIEEENNIFIIDSSNIIKSLKCKKFEIFASGTTLRIGIPILMYLYKHIEIKTSSTLIKRSLDFYQKIFSENNIFFKINQKYKKVEISGNIRNVFKNNIFIKDVVSSQYISGLMFILPFMNSKIRIIFEHKIGSFSYLIVTKNILEKFGIYFNFNEKEINYDRIQKPLVCNSEIDIFYPEIDYSLLTYWLVANEFGSIIKFKNFEKKDILKSDHPDAQALLFLDKQEIDVDQFIDFLPIFITYSLFKKTSTKITGFQRARKKESNRVDDLIDNLKLIGAKIKIFDDEIVINPQKKYLGGTLNSCNDHRLAMSFAILSIKIEEDLFILDKEAVEKSYFYFWKEFLKLGGYIAT